ncbi:hypothetical protein [Iodobacter fluviatilis]|uniref:hypothetical protein n=1 Tax=Iodobacter fluviatilis TaxID=537 RepID=UPI00104554B6|nr:hypothetical protein [Iodobacter fluviatilis]
MDSASGMVFINKDDLIDLSVIVSARVFTLLLRWGLSEDFGVMAMGVIIALLGYFVFTLPG